MTPLRSDHDGAPPIVRGIRGRGRAIGMIFAGVVVAAILLVVVTRLDRTPPAEPPPTPEAFEDLLVGELTAEDRAEAAGDFRDAPVELPEGGGVTIFDDAGRVAQWYRAERLNPLPDHRLEMIRPRARLHLDDDRVIVLAGRRALARQSEDRRLLDGRIEGDVEIRIYEDVAPEADVDLDERVPAAVVLADEASFDTFAGEIVCPRRVAVRTPAIDFRGRGLSVLFSEGVGLRRLVIDRATEPVRIASASFLGAGDPAAPAEAPPRRPTGEEAPLDAPAAAGDDAVPVPPAAPAEPSVDAPAAGEGPAASEPSFYLATFLDDVRIVREVAGEDGAEPTEQIVTGEVLTLVFSLENGDLGPAFAGLAPPPIAAPPAGVWRGPAVPARPMDSILLASLGATRDPQDDATESPASDDPDRPLPDPSTFFEPLAPDVSVEFKGQLLLVPADPEERVGLEPDDVRVEILGNPATVRDTARDAAVACAEIEYATATETILLRGRQGQPVRVMAPRLLATGRELIHRGGDRLARLIGPGEALLRDVERLGVDRPAGSPALNPEAFESRFAFLDDEATNALRVRWTEWMDLVFAPPADGRPDLASGDGADLEAAVFRGDVRVRNLAPDAAMELESDALHVAFDPQAGPEAVEAVLATGGVRVLGLDDAGRVVRAEETLRIDFAPASTPGERPVPRRLTLSGGAWVEDAGRRLSAGSLTAELRPVVDPEGRDETGVEIEHLLAEDDVEIELPDGLRLSGDRLEGDAATGAADLTGERVVLTRPPAEGGAGFTVLGTHARLQESAQGRRVEMRGEGWATIENPPAPPGPDAPNVATDASGADTPGDALAESDPLPPGGTVEVAWIDGAIFTEHPRDERAGSPATATLEILGEVVGTSRPGPTELTLLEGEKATIDLIAREPPDAPAPDAGAFDASNRYDVERVRLFGAPATLESRAWLHGDQTAPPAKVHYVKGRYIDFDTRTRAARIPGEGALLVRDVTPAPGEGPPAWGERGTTLFQWNQGMSTVAFEGDLDGRTRYEARLAGDVAMRHAGPAGDVATLAAPNLAVTLAKDADALAPGTIDLGGETTLERFVAFDADAEREGRAPRRTLLTARGNSIEADRIAYDYATGVMRVLGSPDRPAIFHQTDRGAVERAEAFLWNTRTGAVEATDLRSLIPR